MKDLVWKILNGFFIAVIFGVALRSYARLQDFLFFASLVVLGVLGIDLWAAKKWTKLRGESRRVVLPPLFLAGLFGTIAATSSVAPKVFLVISGMVLFYFFQMRFPQKIRFFEEDLFTLATSFLALVCLWASNFYFTPPWWMLTFIASVIFFLIFWQGFSQIGKGQEGILLALVCTLIMVEVIWAIFFWPVHFMTGAVMSFSVCYLMYILARPYFEQTLTRKKVIFQVVVISLVVFLSLLTSLWQP